MTALLNALSGPRGAAFFLAILVSLVLLLIPQGSSSDLYAMWLAGQHLDTGAVYPPSSDVFTMTPPREWIEVGGDRLFPFLYPPLWAALAAQLAEITTFGVIADWARLLNAMLITCTAALAWRATGSRLPFPVFTGIALLALTQTFTGSLALLENQPQIAVSFLIILAFERARSGAPILAGMALALAAALKVYPVLFALLWFATGNTRALAAFTVTGAALGGLSIALAGWPLHVEFLAQLSTIANTVLLTPVSYAVTPALAQIIATDAFTYQTAAQGGGWMYMPLPLAFSLAAKALLLIALALVARALSRAGADTRDAALWPLALVLVSLLGPLSWAYSYIPAMACLPILLDRFGTRTGLLLIIAIIAPICPPIVALYLDAGPLPAPAQLGGTLSMILMAGAFALAARRAASTTREIAPAPASPPA